MPISVKICTFLIFAGINLRFITENVFNALIFFNILQSGNPSIHFHIHTPSLPVIYGDAVMVFVFAMAYFFIPTVAMKIRGTNRPGTLKDDLGEKHLVVIHQLADYLKNKSVAPLLSRIHQGPIRQIKRYTRWTKDIFLVVSVGFCLYLFSKYILSIGLEILEIENENINIVLNSLNDAIKLCSSLVFAYIYCSYLSTDMTVNYAIYGFFFIRNFLSAHVIGIFTEYDLHVVVPFLDVLTPIIIIYATFYFFTNYRKTLLFKIMGTKHGLACN